MAEIPQKMQAIDISRPGGPEVLVLASVPTPRPGPGELLLRVAAAGLNHADLMQREGHYPPPPGASPILGMELSGHIAALGPGYSGKWQVGDPACALVSGGAYAQYCTVPAGQCMRIPQGVSLIEAATLPEAVITVWANLFEPPRLAKGEFFLVHGGSSGIGSIAIQIANCFGARVATTAGSTEKCRFALGLGAEKAINYRTGDWAAELREWSKPGGLDVILDMVGGDYFPKHLQLLGQFGRLVQIAYMSGSQATVDLGVIMAKRLVVTGSTLRRRTVEEKSALAASAEEHLWPYFASRQLRPVVSASFPLAQAAEAHRMMESSTHMGKLVLQVPE